MKKIIAILIMVAVLMSMSVIAINATSSDNIELPEADTTVAEATEATETEPEQTEPVETEPEVTEAEVTEPEPEIPEEIRGILGTFYCIGNFRQQCFIDAPEYISAITFNADGTIAFRVFYGGDGTYTVGGTYDVTDNMIRIKCDLTGSPFEGVHDYGRIYMEDEFVFEIVDNDNLIFHDTENCEQEACYIIYDGDPFVREQWWLNEEAE